MNEALEAVCTTPGIIGKESQRKEKIILVKQILSLQHMPVFTCLYFYAFVFLRVCIFTRLYFYAE